MTIYSSRVGVSGLCWGARGQSNHAFPCLEGFPENACRRYDAPAFFASGLCLAATILLVSQNMHQSIPAVPLIWILLSQAPGITILFAQKDGKFLGGENYSLIWAICIYLGTCRWTGFWFFGFVFWQSWRLLGREDGELQCVVEI